MATRFQHDRKPNAIFFITFTCIKWKWLFDIAEAYDSVYNWFDNLFTKDIRVNGYVIMPNHVHALLHFAQMHQSLNTIVGNGKRFMAYDIISKLEEKRNNLLLEDLCGFVKKSERKKGQRHKVFEDSFEAKECYSRDFMMQKLNYIHNNPVSKKWQLVSDFTEYEHSSAGYYELGLPRYNKILSINEIW